MHKVLVLGAGLVARPLVRFLLEKGYQVTVADCVLSKAQKVIDGHPNGLARNLDVQDEQMLRGQIRECDLAVSLLPYVHHPIVAKMCVALRKNMVTTSYVSDAMKELDKPAREAGITILNETGLDPGLDHMSAMRVIEKVRRGGGRVVEFRSYCGGLPAPEDNDNPFGYKFSWAPRGVLLAGRNSAQYLLDGRMVTVPAARVFRDMHMLQVEGVGDFEAYPNRDSIGYIDVYGLHGIRTMIRGTLRNPGWCDCLYNYGRLGLLNLEEQEVQGKTYADLMRILAGAEPNDDLARAIARKLVIPAESLPIANLRWLGMLSERKFQTERISPLDALGNLMCEKLVYGAQERDMIVLFHDFRAEYPNGRRERTTSRLTDLGIRGGDSSMARTVSLPAAIAVDLILRGRFTATGVLRPVIPDIYEPVLEELAKLSITCKETTEEV